MKRSGHATTGLDYALAILVVVFAVLIRFPLQGLLGNKVPFLTFFPVILISAWYGGIGPGLLATALSAFASTFLLSPIGSPTIASTGDWLAWSMFVAIGLTICFLTEGLHRSNRREVRNRLNTEQAQSALRENEERLRLALDAGKTGIWDWDIAHNKLTWSDRVYEMHGVSPDTFDASMERYRTLIHPDDFAMVNSAIQQSIEQRVPYQIEFRALTPGGATRWLSTSGQVFHDGDGKPLRMLGATVDITARKMAEQEREQLLAGERAARSEAERSSRLKDEFLATLSHELRTPLNAILGWSQLLRSNATDEADVKKGLDTIERNARAQRQLIEDLLDMSRIISGKVRLDVRRVDLAHVIESAIQTVQPAASAKQITLEREIDRSAPAISGDAGRLQQVIWNLLSNAIKFTPPGGSVRITLGREGPNVQLSITDSGMGIKPEFLPHVFERFRQADSSTTRVHGGLGLGLAIVRHLVELHGGTVRASSAGADQGASFVVTIPTNNAVKQQQDDPPPFGIAAEPDSQRLAALRNEGLSLDGVRVVLVDDDPDALGLIQRILEACQAKVLTALSAAEAIVLLDRETASQSNGKLVLISDIGMPHQDGYSLIRNVRQREASRGGAIPALALTAFARTEDRTRAILAGYQVHLSKPVEPSELVATVACLAGRMMPVRQT